MKKFFAVMVLLCIIVCHANAEVASGTSGSATWSLSDDGTLVISGGAVRTYYRATDVPWNGYSSKIEKVIVEEGVTDLGQYLFDGCGNLKTVSLPSTLKYLGSYTFRNCINLVEIELPDSITYLGTEVFYKCERLKTITLPSGDGFVRDSMFWGCSNLDTVIFEEGTTYIGVYALGLVSTNVKIYVPNSVKNINENIVYGYGIKPTVYCYSDSYAYSFAMKKGWAVVLLDEVTPTIPDGKTLQLPNSVSSIEEMAFAGVDAEAIIISDNIRFISENTFDGSNIRTIICVGHSELLSDYASRHGMRYIEQ